MSEPSEIFLEAIGGGAGSPTMHCSCGRVHYAPDSDYVTDDEAKEMKEDAMDRPDKVVIHDREDGVSGREFNGMTVVIGCKCNWLGKVEALIWNERDKILRYYRLRREADAKALAELDSALPTTAEPPK